MANEEKTGVSADQVDDIVGALEDLADAFKAQRTPAPEIRPVFNVPQSPAPMLPPPQVTVKPAQVTVSPANNLFAKGMRVITERDRAGNVSEYRFLPL